MPIYMIPVGADAIEYIPEYGGQREKYQAGQDDRPAVFWILPLTAGELGRLKKGTQRLDLKNQHVIVENDKFDDNLVLLTSHVVRIDNLIGEFDEVEGEIVPRRWISNGKEFAAALEKAPAEFRGLAAELILALGHSSMLSEGDKKKLSRPGASSATSGTGPSPAATPATTGSEISATATEPGPR